MSSPAPGPWWPVAHERVFGDGSTVYDVMCEQGIVASTTPKEDADLIAAAPEMLSVIESLNTLLDAPDIEKNEARWDDAMEEVEAELVRVAAKARGESQ